MCSSGEDGVPETSTIRETDFTGREGKNKPIEEGWEVENLVYDEGVSLEKVGRSNPVYGVPYDSINGHQKEDSGEVQTLKGSQTH